MGIWNTLAAILSENKILELHYWFCIILFSTYKVHERRPVGGNFIPKIYVIFLTTTKLIAFYYISVIDFTMATYTIKTSKLIIKYVTL